MSWLAVVALSLALAQTSGETPSTGAQSAPTDAPAASSSRRRPRPMPGASGTTTAPATSPSATPEAEAPKSVSAMDAPEDIPFARRGYRVRSLIAAGLGGAMLLTSGTMYALTWHEHNKLTTPGSFEDRDEVIASIQHGRRLQLVSTLTAVAGVGLGVSAGVMLLIDRSHKEEPTTRLVPSTNGFALVGTLP